MGIILSYHRSEITFLTPIVIFFMVTLDMLCFVHLIAIIHYVHIFQEIVHVKVKHSCAQQKEKPQEQIPVVLLQFEFSVH